MPTKRSALLATCVAVVLTVGLAVPALGGGRPFSTELSGENEVDPPIVSTATGTAHLTLNQGQGEVCVDVQSSGYGDGELVVAGHIHRGASDVNGPIVVNLLITGANHSGCVGAERGLIKEIRQNPEGFYVNLHSTVIPSGVIRGQLSK